MTPERTEKFKRVVASRQLDLTVVLENVHDPHNIGAVLRSCDSVGISEIYVLYTEDHLDEEHFDVGGRSSSGAKKWVDVHFFNDAKRCFSAVRSKYERILGTHLNENAQSVYQLDLTQSVALLFGNEHDGLSEEARSYLDGNFIIPQKGMVESLNISVACAVTLYEALRQREANNQYTQTPNHLDPAHQTLLEEYYRRHEQKI